MQKSLAATQIRQYEELGYVAPIRVMSEAAAAELRGRLETYEKATGGALHGSLRHKTHLLFTWLADLVRNENILDVIEDLYGRNLLCWTTNFFIKEAHTEAFVSWHQDSTYWGLSKPDVVTAWVALSSSDELSGAMQVIPGSHKTGQLAHRDTFDANNLLTRGQEIAVAVDESKAMRIDLRPGEMSLHHVRLAHASAPNRSNDRRIGFAIRYVPTYVRQLIGEDSATLVRGRDRYRTFQHERRPRLDMEPSMLELHTLVTQRSAQILYTGTDVKSYDDLLAKRNAG